MKAILHSMTMVSVLALGVAGAQAADLIEAPVVVAPEVFNWTGFYVGVHGGLAAGKNDYSLDVSRPNQDQYLSADDDQNANGGFGGVQIGYNYQFSPNFVVGVEADIAAASLKSDSSSHFDIERNLGPGTFPLDVNSETKVDWFGTIRGRLGYAVDNFLFYGTGGAAYGNVKTSYAATYTTNWNSTSISGENSDTRWGWAAGAGFEYGLTKNITLKTEYLYVDLGSANAGGGTILGGSSPVNVDSADVDVKFHTIKAGLNYKF